jgi:peptide/nickel transport system substrate-binding protein
VHVQSPRPLHKFASALVSMLIFLTACAPAGGSGGSASGPSEAQPAAKKHLVAALLKPSLPNIRENGGDRVVEFALAGLGRLDTAGNVHAQLAEAAPTVENGLWKVTPDGKMETTWKIRTDARWHDGMPITSADYLFGANLARDKEVGVAIDANWSSVDTVEAPDPQTVVIKWNKTYVLADSFPTALSSGIFQLLPKHILESEYNANRGPGLMSIPYWSTGLVHAGPYRVKDWVPDSHVSLEAFEGYVLGRPKIDNVEIRFIGDTNTLVANLLAGAVDMTVGQSISPEQTANLNSTWGNGKGVTSPVFGSSVGILFQFMNANPPILSDLRYRRALIYAFDRQALIDTVLAGQTQIAHGVVGGLHPGANDAAMKYEFDPRRAGQLMEEMGYHKGGDSMWQDAQGRPLTMDVWGVQEEEVRVKTTLTSEGDWRSFGITTNLVIHAPTAVTDELAGTFPATMTRGIAGGLQAGLFNYFSQSRFRLPENNFRGGNTPRYVNAELEGALNRSVATIQKSEREQVINQAIRHITENAVAIGGFYQPYNSAVNNRLVNVTTSSTFSQAWDAHVWDTK